MIALTRWNMPQNLLSESINIMRPHGKIGNEGLALWFGTADDDSFSISHVVDVYGPGFQTSPLNLSLSLGAMAALTNLAAELDAFLIGQIHSHPEQLLDLSELDKQHGIRIPGYLSVVCPYYAQRNLGGMSECGVHIFTNGKYRRMFLEETLNRLIVCDTQVIKIYYEVPA